MDARDRESLLADKIVNTMIRMVEVMDDEFPGHIVDREDDKLPLILIEAIREYRGLPYSGANN